QRTKARSPVDTKRAYAFRPMKFVRGKGKEIDRCIAETNRDFADRLHSIGVKQHTFLATNLSDFLGGKQHASFVVRPHHRKHRRLRANRSFQFGETDIALSIDSNKPHGTAIFSMSLPWSQHTG